MDINYVSIGKRIRELRVKRGWTQAALAERSGVEPSNISHIERAATKLSLQTLISIANAFEVTLDEIAYGSLVQSDAVSAKIINELLADCTAKEISALTEILKSAKSALRSI